MADPFVILDPDFMDRMEEAPATFSSASGRSLAYSVYGAADGRPCFWFHGSPSCRLEAVLLDAFGRRRGFRFIATDRPGVGRSAPALGWTMTGFAADVVSLADALGLQRFSVAGGSGGGPFVLAMAAVAPDRIDRAVSLACAGAFEVDAVRDHIGWVDRLAAWAAPMPGVLPLYFGGLGLLARTPTAVADALAGAFRGAMPAQDGRLLSIFLRTLREATRDGAKGIVEDTRVLHQPWGFDVAALEVEIDYVNGTHDEFVPVAYGRELAERTPRARLHVVDNADHFTTIFNLHRLGTLLS